MRLIRMRRVAVGLLLLGGVLPGSGADLKVARVFADHGVLQQGVSLPVWGTATPGVEVRATFGGESRSGTTDAKGHWSLTLPPFSVDGVGKTLAIESDDAKIEIRDLLVGEVWYASGQSNMQMSLAACAKRLDSVAEVIGKPTSRLIRTLRIGTPDHATRLADFPEPVMWQIDTPESRSGQSAAAYFFAQRLHDALGRPIGIIEGAWGGKPIEGFIPREEFATGELLRSILRLADAEEFEALKVMEGGAIIRNTAGRPGRIFHSRVAPLAPYPVKGFIWYQGESNAGAGEDPRHYQLKMEALITGWRRTWEDPDLPFYFVQLPSFKESAEGWVRLREEQRLSLSIPHTGMAVTIDLRDEDIHPANKVDVGERLAAWALAQSYDRAIPFSGPLFRSAAIEGSQIRVAFDHVGDGLMIARKEGVESPMESEDLGLAHFEIADDSGSWFPAEAKIDGVTVVVSSSFVSVPAAVRYAWGGAPASAHLYNQAGLPASPFCSNLALLPEEAGIAP